MALLVKYTYSYTMDLQPAASQVALHVPRSHLLIVYVQFRQLGLPLNVIFPVAAPESAHSNGCGPLP